VGELTFAVIDVHAPFHKLPEHVLRRPVHDGQIVVRGQDDIDLCAAHGRCLQRADQVARRQEIGGNDDQPVLGRGGRAYQDHGQPPQVLIGAVDDGTAQGRPGVPRPTGGRVITVLAGGEIPILEEYRLHLLHHRAAEAEVDVPDPVLAGVVAVADVHTAGESGMAVHDQDFAVVAQVEQ